MASRGSNVSTRRPTSGASSCRARIAACCSGCGSSGCGGRRAKPETAHYQCEACDALDRGASQDGHARRRATGSRPRKLPIPARSAFIYRRSIRRSAGSPGATSPGMWEAAQSTDEAKRSFKNSVLGETWIETGEAPDWQRLYDRREAWQIGTVPTGRSVPDRRRRRSEGPDRGFGLGLGARPRKLARRAPRHRGRTRARGELGRAQRLARPHLAACAWRAAWAREARDRHRLRDARGLCLGAQGRPCTGGSGQGRRGLQSGGAGHRADLRRCDRSGPQAAARRAALDDRSRDLQERDLSVPAA